MNAIDILESIDRAFPLEPKPAVSLRQATLTDQGIAQAISEKEWLVAGREDGHLSWKEISDSALIECNDGVAHLIDDSFPYYLGAFLSFAIRHINAQVLQPGWDLVGTVVFTVTHMENYNLSRLKSLNEKQIDCVTDFLKFVATHNETHQIDAELAPKYYWLTSEAKKKGLIYVP